MRGCWIVLVVAAACGDAETDVQPPITPPPAGISAPASLALVEGEAKTFSVRLANVPREGVVVNVFAVDPSAVTVKPSTMAFTPTEREAEVTVTTAEDDDDLVNEVTSIVLAIDDGDEERVATTVYDNDKQQIVIDATNVTVNESATTTFGVRLARQQSEALTLHVWTDAPGVAAVTPATLTFDPSSYNVTQVVSVTGVVDADLEDETARVYVGDAPLVGERFVEALVTDDDVQALVLSATNVPLTEGANVPLTVSLAFDPGFMTNVILQSSDPSAVGLSAGLQFTSANYSVPQTVTLVAVEDADTVNEAVTIALSGAASGSVTVPVLDNDLIQVDAVGSALEGEIVPLSVRLADAPGTAGMTVTATVLSGNVTINPASQFMSPTDYGNVHSFQVATVADYNSSAYQQATVRLSAPGQTPRDVTFTIADRYPGSMFVSVLEESPYTGAIGYIELGLYLTNSWPADGRAVIAFPPGFDVAGAVLLSSTVDGVLTFAATTSTVTIVRSGGTASSGVVTLRIGNVRSPSVSGLYPLDVSTQTSAGDRIDQDIATARIEAGPLSSVTVTLGDLSPAATTTATISFATGLNPWPADAWLAINFPQGFDVSSTTVSAQSGLDGTLVVAASGSWVTLKRSGGTTIPGNSAPITITLANIINPLSAQATNDLRIATMTPTQAGIEAALVNGFVIGCPATMTKAARRGRNVPSGGQAWIDPMGVTGPGAYIEGLVESDYLVADDFRFTVPAGAAVTGIEFEVNRRSTDYRGVDSSVRIVKSTIGQAERASPSVWTFPPASYGGATDLWGETWTAADFESDSFGIAVAGKAADPTMPSYRVSVTYIAATLHLSCP